MRLHFMCFALFVFSGFIDFRDPVEVYTMPGSCCFPFRMAVLSRLFFWIFLVSGMVLVVSASPCFAIPAKTGTGAGSDMMSIEEMVTLDMLYADPDRSVLTLVEVRFKQGKWEEAAFRARDVLFKNKDNVKAHGVLATIYALTAQKDMAEKERAFLSRQGDGAFFLYLTDAMFRAQEGEFQKAQDQLEAALKESPGHPVAVYYRGSVYLAQNQLEAAQKAFETVISSFPDFAAALAGLGQVHVRQQDMSGAARFYLRAVDAEPENLIYRRELVDIYKALGRNKESDAQIKAMVYHAPGVKQSYLSRGMQLVSEGAYAEAIDLMDKALRIYGTVPEAYYIKAAALVNLQDTDRALDNLQSFISKKMGIPLTHHYAGMCYLALGKTDAAERQFTAVISITPDAGKSFVPLTVIEQLRGNYARALEGLRLAKQGGEPPALIDYLAAHVLLAKGDETAYRGAMKGAVGLIPGLDPAREFIVPENQQRGEFAEQRNLTAIYFFNNWYGKALESTDYLLKLNSEDRFAWYFRALSAMAHKRADTALEAFERLTVIEPNLVNAHMGLGRIQMQSRNYDGAEKAFKQVIQIDPDYADGHMAMGDLSLETGEDQKAMASYQKAIALQRDLTAAYQKLALMLCEEPGKLDEAMALATKAFTLTPEDPISLDVLGWVYLQKGDTDKAIEKLTEASKRLPQHPVILYHLGVAHYRSADREEAKRALKAAIGLSKDFRGAKHALELLKKLEG